MTSEKDTKEITADADGGCKIFQLDRNFTIGQLQKEINRIESQGWIFVCFANSYAFGQDGTHISPTAGVFRRETKPIEDRYEYRAEKIWTSSPEYGVLEQLKKEGWEFMPEASAAFNETAKLTSFDKIYLFRRPKRK